MIIYQIFLTLRFKGVNISFLINPSEIYFLNNAGSGLIFLIA